MARVISGQVLLVICCIFYLIWWSISYRPGIVVNRAGGINGVLLLITAVCGLAGMVLSLYGANALPGSGRAKLSGPVIIICGIAAYFVLLAVTSRLFDRPVTTELILITGWAMLELTVISRMNVSGGLSDGRFWLALVIIAAAFAVSMILYVMYYRMDPMPAFYAAMVPLITEAASMSAIVLIALF